MTGAPGRAAGTCIYCQQFTDDGLVLGVLHRPRQPDVPVIAHQACEGERWLGEFQTAHQREAR